MIDQIRARGIAAVLTLLAACSSEGDKGPSSPPGTTGDGRVTINSDGEDLSDHVDAKDEPVPVQPAGAGNMLVVLPDLMYQLTLIAEVAPAQIDGVDLMATAVAFQESKALVSYNTAGASQQGAIDVFVVDAEKKLSLTSRATFDDTEVHAVGAHADRVYLATSTADESFGTPAVLEALSLSGDGALTLDGHVRVGLSSFAATSVAFADGLVFATSGNAGGVWSFDPAAGTVARSYELSDARWIAPGEAGTVVAVAGTPGRLSVLGAATLDPIDSYPFEGAQVAESKATVEVLGGKAFVAGGPGGTIVIDLASGDTIATIPVPTGLPFAPSEMVTNAVSVDGDLVFVSNGSAGVFLVTASQDLAEPYDPENPPVFSMAGRLVFPGEVASVNHIAYKDGLLFVATGRGGLKVVRVEQVVVPYQLPAGYPYVSGFDVHTLRSGWTFTGGWGWGAPDGERVGKSGAFIDNDPAGVVVTGGAESTATLDTALIIPESGAPLLSFWYGLAFADAADQIELQVDDGTGWQTLATFTAEHARAAVTRFVQPLDDFRGKTLHLRLRQTTGAAVGVRRFTLDELAVAESDLPVLSWPFESGFESALEREAWTLAGAWEWAAGDAFEGAEALAATAADGASADQTAELFGWVPVPVDGTAVAGFWYRAALGADDELRVLAQAYGSAAWQELEVFGHSESHDGWSYAEVALDAFKGGSLRLRFEVDFPGAGARAFAIDGIYVGPIVGASVAWPSVSGFAGTDAASWVTSGMVDFGAGDDGAAVVVDAAAGPGGAGAVQLLDFVTVPAGTPTLLRFRARLGLADAADEVTLEAQDLAVGGWQTLARWSGAEAHDAWTSYEVPVDALAGKAVRVRFAVSYGGAAGVRHVAIDDVTLGGMPEGRYGWPHSMDADDFARWSLSGAWGGGEVLDANPDGVAQSGQGAGHVATMDGFIAVPASGRPTLFANLDLFLSDAADEARLEVQEVGSNAWQVMRRYGAGVNRDAFGWDEVALDAWAGQTVRVRLSYDFGASAEARTLALGGLRFEDLSVPGFAYPWESGFEAGQHDAWNVWGAWRQREASGQAEPYSGAGFLDGNPGGVAQQGLDTLQTVTMEGAVTVPMNAPSWLALRHQVGALGADDTLAVEVQTPESAAWTTLALLGGQHAHGDYTKLELGLDAYRGKALRARLVMRLGQLSAVREVRVDDVHIGPLALPTVAAPLVMNTFHAGPGRDFALHGGWEHDANTLNANPQGKDMGGYDGLHTATLDTFVDCAQVPGAKLTVRFTLGLTDQADRAYFEVQPDGVAQWFTVATLKPANNGGDIEGSYSLSAWSKPLRVRARIAPSSAAGVRAFVIERMSIGVPAVGP